MAAKVTRFCRNWNNRRNFGPGRKAGFFFVCCPAKCPQLAQRGPPRGFADELVLMGVPIPGRLWGVVRGHNYIYYHCHKGGSDSLGNLEKIFSFQ